MKNKESRSATNGSASISTKISAKEEIDSSTCIARKNGINVMANKNANNVTQKELYHTWINLIIDPENSLVSKRYMSYSSKRTLY